MLKRNCFLGSILGVMGCVGAGGESEAEAEGEGGSESEAEAESESESEAESESESEAESEGECAPPIECALSGMCSGQTMLESGTVCSICLWTCANDDGCPTATVEDKLVPCFSCLPTVGSGGTLNLCQPRKDADSACWTGEPGMICMGGSGMCLDGGPCYYFEGWDQTGNGVCSSACSP